MPLTFDEYLAGKRKPVTFDAFMAKKADTVAAEPEVPEVERDILDERVPMLQIPRIKPGPRAGKLEAFLGNIPIAAAELGINLPGWLMEMTRQARYGGDEPTELDVISPEGKLQVPEMVRGLVAPSAKLAAGIKTRGETEAGKELFGEALGETVTHPESILLPFLIAAGARGGRGRIARAGKAPKAPVEAGIISDIIPKERIPTERVPIVEEILGVEKPRPKLEVAKREVKAEPAPRVRVADADLRAELKTQNQQGARWRLTKNPQFGKQKIAGGKDLDPFILRGTNVRGQTGQAVKGNADFILETITRERPPVIPKAPPPRGAKIPERGAVLNPFQEIASKVPKLSESGAVDMVRRVVSESRNRVKSPEGKKIIAEMEDVRADRYTLAGEFITRFRNVKRRPKGKVLTEELLQEPTRIGKPDLLTMILEMERSQKKVSPASKEVRAILDDIAQEAIDAGIKVMDAEGKLKSFKPRENYVPRRLKEKIAETIFDDIAKAETKLDELATTTQGFVDRAVIRRMRRQLGEPTAVGKQIVRLSDKTKQAINHIMEKQGVDFEKAYGMLRRFLDNEKYNPFGNLEKARVLDLPSEFYESNFNRIFPDYVMGASRAIAEVRKWGPQRKVVLNKMSDLAKSNPKDFELVNQLYEMSTGLWEKNRPMSPTAKKAIHAFMNYEVTTKIGLGTAAIPNISQTLISTGIKGPWLKVLSGGTRYMTSKDFRIATRSSGATVAEAMQMLTGVETRGLGTGITKTVMTPFSMINRANKAIAASTAKQWIPSLMKTAKKGGVKSSHAKRQLKSLGIDWEKPLTEKDLRKGMFRMASDTQLQRDIFKEPVWMNDPKLRPFALFKRFGYRQFNFTRVEVFKEARLGNPMPLLRLATGGYIGGRFVLTAKGLVKKWISGEPYDDKDQSMLQHLANVYAAVGALGMASDVFRSYSETGRGKARDIIGNILFQTTPLPIAEPISFGESAKRVAGAKEPLRQTAKELLSQAPLLRHAKKRLSKPKKKKTRSILSEISAF